MHSVQLLTIELLINFFRNCPCECNLWTKCLLHQPFSVWESCICLIWDKLLCILYWSLNRFAFGLFPLCWKFKFNYHPHSNCLGMAFWFIVVNFQLFVLVLFGFVGCCFCCWFLFFPVNGWSPVCRWDLLRRKVLGRVDIGVSFVPRGACEFELRRKWTSVDGWRRDLCHCSVPSGSAQSSPGPGLDEWLLTGPVLSLFQFANPVTGYKEQRPLLIWCVVVSNSMRD